MCRWWTEILKTVCHRFFYGQFLEKNIKDGIVDDSSAHRRNRVAVGRFKRFKRLMNDLCRSIEYLCSRA
jgi:hypothetical protein